MSAADVAAVSLVGWDPALADHVGIAVRGYRRALLAANRSTPVAIDQLVDALDRVAKSGHFDHLKDVGAHAPGHAYRLLDLAEVSMITRLSERTLRRRIADRSLPVERLGRRVLVRPEVLLGYLGAAS